MSEVQDWIRQTVSQRPVVVFMKGTPEQPQCGFSQSAVTILRQCGINDMTAINVLASNEVRQAVKDYSNWPTLPQVFIHGEFIGGADILAQMHQSGELQKLLDE